MSGVFKFKQFSVDQSGCAMKINTDGVLLAALTEAEGDESMLDIGTGTGVIALMLAQRFSLAKIHAIEIDEEASVTAGSNFKNSLFADRLSVQHIAVENFTSVRKFDLIISNPPFFLKDLRSAEEKKGIARHATDEFFSSLMAKVAEHLSPKGSFWFILPVKQAELLIDDAQRYGFSVAKHIMLHSDVSKPPFRWIICLTRVKIKTDIVHFYIYEAEKQYTKQYKSLLADFFLGY
ncbi:MAG: tRNA1(Val) (adenine(37)-N6)-methyltransferase [Bacteroidia bacterium]